jgi:hypothetical protein
MLSEAGVNQKKTGLDRQQTQPTLERVVASERFESRI